MDGPRQCRRRGHPGPALRAALGLFDTSEPAAVFYTLDGSRPTYASTPYAAAGIREGAETLTVPAGTTIHWFSVDSSGNIEGNYDPSSSASNYSKTTVG